ncbi:MAG TPA: hypothetical protein VGL72_11390 [Bryobacteraceae bacterium]|jgi:hypothetical protein
MKFQLPGCVVLLFVATSCAIPMPRHVPFNEADFAAYRGPGTGTVVGKLAVSTDEGIKEGYSADIELIPVTPYTEEMVEVELGQGFVLMPPADSRFKKYARFAKADSHGNFVISQVPPGRYFICGEVDWLPIAAEDYDVQWGLERITMGKGQTVNITVTHNPNHGHIVLGIGKL